MACYGVSLTLTKGSLIGLSYVGMSEQTWMEAKRLIVLRDEILVLRRLSQFEG
jgi:hypothetical protein